MVSLADYAPDERTSRVMLSMLTEPDDANVGRLLRREGGIETLRLLDTDGPVPGVRPEEAAILQHRAHLVSSGVDFDAVLRRALDGTHEPLILATPIGRSRSMRWATAPLCAVGEWGDLVPRDRAGCSGDDHGLACIDQVRRSRRRRTCHGCVTG